MAEETLNSKELIYLLFDLCSDKQFKKPKPLPKFTIREMQFIRDLIFLKPKDLVYFYIADAIANRTEIGADIFNSKSYRKYKFLMEYIRSRGNATRAAINSGYSPRSAKQQGYRLLRQIQRYFQ